MARYHWLSLLVLSTLGACAALVPATTASPAFETLSIQVAGQGAGRASRSISANGEVRGMHSSGGGFPPMIAQSQEQARAEDLAAITKQARDLPAPEPAPAAEAGTAGWVTLAVGFQDGTVRRYYRRSGEDFKDSRLMQLQKILFAYKAGYW